MKERDIDSTSTHSLTLWDRTSQLRTLTTSPLPCQSLGPSKTIARHVAGLFGARLGGNIPPRTIRVLIRRIGGGPTVLSTCSDASTHFHRHRLTGRSATARETASLTARKSALAQKSLLCDQILTHGKCTSNEKRRRGNHGCARLDAPAVIEHFGRATETYEKCMAVCTRKLTHLLLDRVPDAAAALAPAQSSSTIPTALASSPGRSLQGLAALRSQPPPQKPPSTPSTPLPTWSHSHVSSSPAAAPGDPQAHLAPTSAAPSHQANR